MQEVIMLAQKEKVQLSNEDIKNWETVLFGLNPEGKTSMLQDVEAHRKTEVEMFAGKVIELGRRHNIPTPVNQKLFDMIREIEGNINQRSRRKDVKRFKMSLNKFPAECHASRNTTTREKSGL